MADHIIDPRVYFGAADGSENFYCPMTSSVRLVTVQRQVRRTSARMLSKFGSTWAGVPAKSPNQVTPLSLVMSIQQEYQGAIQSLIGEIEQYIGGSSADQPKHMWYADDPLQAIEASNAESAGSTVSVEFSGSSGFFSAGSFLFYPSGDSGVPDEVVVVDALYDSASYFEADLQNNHLAGVSLFEFQWCYQNVRLDSIIPQPSVTGRSRLTVNLISEGQPLSGSTLPS